MIIIEYPPDYDGELHVNVIERADGCYQYSFAHTKRVDGKESTQFEVLVAAAKAIVAYDKHLKDKKPRSLHYIPQN